MRELFTNKYFILLLAVTVALLFLMGIYTTERNKTTFVEDAGYNLLTPVQQLVTSVTNGVGGFFGYFKNVKALEVENIELKNKVAELENQNRSLEEMQMENKRLREMLDFKDNNSDYTLVAASVIAKDPGNWFNSFTINKGTSDGLANNTAVVTSLGVVGHIYEIGTNWAKVVSVIDATSSLGCAISRTGDIAVAEGDALLGQEGLCKLTYITKGSNVIPGDLIETSGLGGIYPKGLLIGKVREVKPETYGISQYAIIEPAVSFERITEVFVVKK